MEPNHVQGDLSYYIGKLNKDGSYALNSSEDEDTMTFFSSAIRNFFNTRFHQLKLTKNGVKTMGMCKMGSLVSGLMDFLFFPVKLRLKFDFWDFFIEARLIGKIFRYGTSLYKFMARAKALFI